VDLSIAEGKLTLHVRGADKLWAFKSSLEIPLVHITGVRVDPEIHAAGTTESECPEPMCPESSRRRGFIRMARVSDLAERQSLNASHRRRLPTLMQSPQVAQRVQSARHAERLSIAECYTRAPDTSAEAHPQERFGERRHRIPWACRRRRDQADTSGYPSNHASTMSPSG
jgi:hypothetical protein